VRPRGIYVLGPRIGRFDADGNPRAIPGHNIPIAIVGVIILVFGWFGSTRGAPSPRRPAAVGGRGEHPACRLRRLHDRHVLHVEEVRKARSFHDR